MNNLNYLKDNIISRRWKKKYEKCSDEIKDKLDKLDEMYISEYQLQVIKRSKKYPEIGDVFKICPYENIEFSGVVVNNHVDNKNGNDLIVIFIFKSEINIAEAVQNGIKMEDLLISPEIVSKEYWTKGFFYNVDHVDINVNNYGFYSIGKCKFFDEYGSDIYEEPYLLGTYGVATISGIAYGINQELIIAGII